MANVIKLKRNSTASAVPTGSDIVDGEACLNTTDRLLYVNMGGTITTFVPEKAFEQKTTSFTAEYHKRYDLHSTADVTITLPTWEQNKQFEIVIDGDTKNHAITFAYSTVPINGQTSNVSATTKTDGDVFIITATGPTGDKHWSVARIPGI